MNRFLVWIPLTVLAVSTGTEPLTNEDIVALVKGGCGEGLVLQAIHTHRSLYDVSPTGLDRLAQAGIGRTIVSAVLEAEQEREPHARLLDPGVYVKRGETYSLIEPERTRWHSSAPASISGSSFVRVSLVGQIERKHSLLRLGGPSELLIVAAPSHSAAEFQLVKAETKDDSREIHTHAALRGGKLTGVDSGGSTPLMAVADPNFDLGVRILVGSLRKGEYAILPPGLIVNGQPTDWTESFTFGVD